MDISRPLLAARRSVESVRSNPVAHFRFSSKGQRDFVASLAVVDEAVLQSANQTGKTTGAAYAIIAMLQGEQSLAGDIVGLHGVVESLPPVQLPLLSNPCHFLALAHGREMSKLSMIEALKSAVGAWPHHWEKAGNVIAALWVKPKNSTSDKWMDWSSIRLFVEDGQSVEGMRLDGVWADEPPKWDLWYSLRMRGKANKKFVMMMTFTPIDKPRWKPLREDFRGCEGEPKDGKLVIRMSVYDNKRLSRSHIADLEKKSRGALQRAKLYGDFVDTTGSNPFDGDGLSKWRDRCRPGEIKWFDTARGRKSYEVWAGYDPTESYMVVFDLSAGIEDENRTHDPTGGIVVARRKPRVVARFNGYIPAFEAGKLARKWCDEYGRALCVWERNAGFGETFYLGLNKYGNVYIERHTDKTGATLSERLGWNTSGTSRGSLIGALQKAIETDSLFNESLDAVESITDVEMVQRGQLLRPESTGSAHDEDMIIYGLACLVLETYPVRGMPQTMDERFRRQFGVQESPLSDQQYADW